MIRPVARRSVLTSVVGVTLAGCLGLALASCGSSSGNGGGGTSAYDENGLALDYPGDWIKDRPVPDKGIVVNVHGPARADKTYVRVTLLRQKKQFATLDAFARSVKDDRSLTLKTSEPNRLEHVTLSGGVEARRIVTPVTYRLKSGRTVPFTLRETVAVHGDEQFRLTVFAPKDDADSATVAQIERSLKIPG